MEKRLKYALIAVILVSLVFKFSLIFANEGLWWDEAVYLGLGRSVLKGYYSLEQGSAVETFRPPLFPVLFSVVSGSVPLTRIIVALISVFSVVATYALAKELFGRETALWASLLMAANHLFIFFSTKALTEPLFISFLSLSRLFLFRGEKKGRYWLVAGLFAGLAFLTRYLGTILVASCLLYFLFLFFRGRGYVKTAKGMAFFLAGFLVALVPWLLLSYGYYGNVFGAYLTNLGVFSWGPATTLTERIVSLTDIFGFQLAFVLLGFYVAVKKTRRKLDAPGIALIAIFTLPAVFVMFASHVEPRYLLSFLPVYAIFFGVSLKNDIGHLGKFLKPIALALCILSMYAGFQMIWNDRVAAEGLVQGSLYLKGITAEKDVVMSESYPYVYYLSERRAIRFPPDPENLMGAVKNNDVGYVLLYKFEPGNPAYTADYFDKNANFERIKSFGQWGDPEAVIIYKVI